MRAHVLVAPFLQANCTVLDPEDGTGRALVVDPGVGTADLVAAHASAAGLTVTGVLLTHGHLDHVGDAPLLAADGAAVLVGAGDAYRLDDPVAQLAAAFGDMARQALGDRPWRRPDGVRPMGPGGDDPAGSPLELGGVRLVAHPAPGHTEGSTLWEVVHDDGVRLTGAFPAEVPADAGFLLTGDVLFRGAIGRVDLHGGDGTTMTTTLTEVLPRFADGTVFVPGHGPASTLGQERADNPYLRAAAAGTLAL